MPSPQRSPRGSPPKRAALHERTDSHTNERSLRMVGDPQAPIYGMPYPTKPSQILSPRGYPGPTVGAQPGVSGHRNAPGETKEHIGDSGSLPPSQRRNRSPVAIHVDDALSTQQSSTTASFYTPQTTTPSMDTSTSCLATDPPMEESGRISDDIVQLPSVPSRSELSRQYAPNSSDPLERQPVQAKDSESSLSSSNSTDTVIVKKNRDGKKRASYSAFPSMARPSSSRYNQPQSTPQESAATDLVGQQFPISPVSPCSPISLSFATSTECRSSSSPIHGNLQDASQSSVNLQYPVIRPPSASASWVEPPPPTPERAQRTLERNQDRWNPHLSTVQSEGTGSQSEGRSSQSTWLQDSTRVSKSSSMALNGRGSLDLSPRPSPPPSGTKSYIPILSSPPLVNHRDLTGSTIRVVNEQEDHLPALQPIPGSRDSEHLGVPSASGDNRKSLITRRGSNMSFFHDSIPAWAKAYYARPQSSSSLPKSGHGSRPSTSTDNISLRMFRRGTRHTREANGQPRRDSLAIGPVRPNAPDLTEIRGPPRRRISPNWSPHLWHDRTSLGRRRTIFQAPSIDEQAEGKAPSKRNAQIALFVIGFIFPFGWFIASFLPLPQRPQISSIKGKNNPNRTQFGEGLEKQLGPVDEARYENARWWRNINRIMSLIGIVIVVAVITIAAVSAT